MFAYCFLQEVAIVPLKRLLKKEITPKVGSSCKMLARVTCDDKG